MSGLEVYMPFDLVRSKIMRVTLPRSKAGVLTPYLRDIIDLEATYAGPDAKTMPATGIGLDGQPLSKDGSAPPGKAARPTVTPLSR